MQRLGKNIGRYQGEGIDIPSVLRDITAAIAQKNWKLERIHVPADAGSSAVDFIALRRFPGFARKRVYLSAGIHGDEPAGPLAVLQLLREDQWPLDAALWVCPCLNPMGFAANRRENAEGIDLNRDYRHLKSAEVRTHVDWLQKQPGFDIAICLHEDWESQGFYVYEVNPDKGPSLAEKITERVAKICPIDVSPVIENWPAENGVIRPAIHPEGRPQWPEALFLVANKTRLSYTMEAPSDFELGLRVTALVTAVRAVLDMI